MSGNKVIKSVSFNKQNDEDNKMIKHFSRRNFSGYVKKLIMQDIKRKEEEKQNKAETLPSREEKPTSASEELQQMKQQKRERQGAPPAPNVFIKKQ